MNSNKPLEIYFCNSSYVSGDPLNDPNCAYVEKIDKTDTINLTVLNSSYIQNVIFSKEGYIDGVKVTDEAYFVLRTTAPAALPYRIYYADDEVSEYINFTNFQHAWISTDSGNTWVMVNYTPDFYIVYTQKERDKVMYYVYACDIYDNCANSTMHFDSLDPVNHPPAEPLILTPTENETITGLYNITWITLGDPDFDPYNASVYLLYPNGTVYYTLADNNITQDYTYLEFNASQFPTGKYRVKVELCDIYNACSYSETPYNFTIYHYYEKESYEPITINYSIGRHESAFKYIEQNISVPHYSGKWAFIHLFTDQSQTVFPYSIRQLFTQKKAEATSTLFALSTRNVLFYKYPLASFSIYSFASKYLHAYRNVLFTIGGEYYYDMLYKRQITITEQSGTTLTDYQVKLTIDTQTLISQGKMRSDCGDIRFTWYNTTSSTEQNISYWIESGCNTANTIVWIKVPEIPASSSTTVYMYYGNPDATSESNGDNVFELFDDFDGTSLDTSKWQITVNGDSSYNIDNSTLYMHIPNVGDSNRITLQTNTNFSKNLIFRTKRKANPNSGRKQIIVGGDTRAYYELDTNDCVESFFLTSSNHCGNTEISPRTDDNNWHIIDIAYVIGQEARLYIDGVFKKSITASFPTNYTYIHFAWTPYWKSNPADIYIDYIYARKFTDPEPTYSVGGELSIQYHSILLLSSTRQRYVYRYAEEVFSIFEYIKKKITKFIDLIISLFTEAKYEKYLGEVEFDLPNGYVYGINEHILISGNVTIGERPFPGATVYIYYYPSNLTIENATYVGSTTADENGYFNYTMYISSTGNYTIYVNITKYKYDEKNVSIIVPVVLEDLSNTKWMYRSEFLSDTRTDNFYTQLVKINVYRPIINITFSNSNSKLQPFYRSDHYGAYSDCEDIDVNETCYVTYKYYNLPVGTNNLAFSYTVNYVNGGSYSSSHTTSVNVTELIKNFNYDVIDSGWYYIGNSTETFVGTVSSDCWCGGCGTNVDKFSITWSLSDLVFEFNASNYSYVLAKVEIYYENLHYDGLRDDYFDAGVYIDGSLTKTIRQRWCTYSGSTEYTGHEGGSYFFKLEPGYHNITVRLTSYPSESIKYGAGNVKARVTVYGFNKTNVIEVPLYTGTFSYKSKIFDVNTNLSHYISDNSYAFFSLYPYPTDSSHERDTLFVELNGVKNTHFLSYAFDFSDTPLGVLSSFNKNLQLTNNNITYYHMQYDDVDNVWEYFNAEFKLAYFYYSLNDFDIEFVNISHNNLSNIRGNDINILWIGLNDNQTITYKITNIAPYNFSEVNVTLYSSIYPIQSKVISLNSGESKYVTFEIQSTNIEVLRGFGLDTFIIVARTPEGGYGFTWNNFRILPYKHADVTLIAPDRVQAGSLFSIYTTFTPYDYSIFYPHVMVDLDGTFGFETGVSTAYLEGSSGVAIKRCFDVTMWSDLYEPGVQLAYTTTSAGTVFSSDSLRISPQHRYYVYDRYGFLNITKGNETYEIGKILLGYGVIQPGDWDMYGVYDMMLNGFSAEAGTIYSDRSLGDQFLYKFLDITEVPQSLNIISGPDTQLPNQTYNWVSWNVKSMPLYIYQSGGYLYVKTFPTDPSTYWIPCLQSGYAPLVPPFNIYVLYVKTGNDAFSLPAGERLAKINNEWIEPGQTASGITFKALAPLEPGIYNITAIVWDDAETGLFWYKTKQIRVVQYLPKSLIVVSHEDFPNGTVYAKKLDSNDTYVTMIRKVLVTNYQGFNDTQVSWVANPLPPDAIWISGDVSGVIDYICNNCTVNPSNITYKVPGVIYWLDSIDYDSNYIDLGSNITGKINIYVKDNSTSTSFTNVHVNITDILPEGATTTTEEYVIDKIYPEQKLYYQFSWEAPSGRETTWSIEKPTNYYRYTSNIEIYNNISSNLEIRYHIPLVRLPEFSSTTIKTIKLNGKDVGYMVSSTELIVIIPTDFSDNGSLYQGNYTFILEYYPYEITPTGAGFAPRPEVYIEPKVYNYTGMPRNITIEYSITCKKAPCAVVLVPTGPYSTWVDIPKESRYGWTTTGFIPVPEGATIRTVVNVNIPEGVQEGKYNITIVATDIPTRESDKAVINIEIKKEIPYITIIIIIIAIVVGLYLWQKI